MEQFVTKKIANTIPKTVKKYTKKKNEHCDRQIPTNKYNKNTA